MSKRKVTALMAMAMTLVVHSDASATTNVARCDTPIGYLSVIEISDVQLEYLWVYRLRSPSQLIRLLVQESNCFKIVDRGLAADAMFKERQLAARGQLQPGSGFGEGQMIAADFILTPGVIFSNRNAGKLGATVGGFLGGRHWNSISPSVRLREARTTMMLADARSGLQVAAADGVTRQKDLALEGWLSRSGSFASLEGYGNTSEGKLIATTFLDNYNKIVARIRDDASLRRDMTATSRSAAAYNEHFTAGEVIVPKIANVALQQFPAEDSAILRSLDRFTEMVVLGTDQNGFIPVQIGDAKGWVRKLLVRRN
jgi:hypothetical protein